MGKEARDLLLGLALPRGPVVSSSSSLECTEALRLWRLGEMPPGSWERGCWGCALAEG